MNERKYLALRKALEDEFKEKIRALDLVWAMVRDDQPKRATEPSRGVVISAVRNVLPVLPSPFGLDEAMKVFGDRYPGLTKSNVSTALRRLADANELTVARPGLGRRGTRYLIPGVATNPGPRPAGPQQPPDFELDIDPLPPEDEDDMPL